MKTTEQKGSLTLVFLIGIIVGFGLCRFMPGVFGLQLQDPVVEDSEFISEEEEIMVKDDASSSGEVVMTETKPLSVVAQGENTLVIENQPAGMAVVMSMVALDASGWVAIHENIEGEPGVILGARRFNAGTYFAETIELLRATGSESGYMAVLHADNGDSEFDFKIEVPVKDGLGNIIAEEFLVTSGGVE